MRFEPNFPCFIFTSMLLANSAAAEVVLTPTENRIDIAAGGKPFTTFFFGPDAPKPYFHPLRSASGKVVTRRFPMEAVPEDGATDKHHRGLWLGYGDINGYNFWENEFSYNNPKAGKVVTRSVTSVDARISGKFAWLSPSGAELLEENRVMSFREAGTATRVIDFDITLKAISPVTFGDSKDGFFAVRVAETLNERHTGELLNASGGRKMAGTWGKPSNWVDYSGVIEAEHLGIAVFAHPSSFRNPPRWHVRDYGLLASNPFASSIFDKQAPAVAVTLAPGEEIHLKYRVVIHAALETAALAEMYEQYSSAAAMPELRIEPIDGGSVFFVKNNASKPLAAYLIELVDYPGSAFAMVQDETNGEPLAPGAEKRIQRSNMIVAAAPGYVKLLAAVYGDGSAAGAAEKVTQLLEFRGAKLATIRELIQRIEKAKAGSTSKAFLISDLMQWRESTPEPDRRARYQAVGLLRAAVKSFIASVATSLEIQPLDEVLIRLQRQESVLTPVK